MKLPRHRGAAALRPAVGGRAAPGLRAAHRPADRAGHQRRRDLAHRARASATSSTPAPPASRATASAPRCSGCRSSRFARPSANQRAGRCGRVADGICIRLYSEDDYDARPEFTEPEIQRTNLASVILQMTSLGLGDIAAFPFVDAPDAAPDRRRRPAAEELQAFAPDRRRRSRRPEGGAAGTQAHGIRPSIARLPVDPRLGRMLIEADRLRLCPRGARHRRGPVHPGPARAAAGQAGARPTSACALPRRALRLRVAAQPVGLPQGAAEELSHQRFSADVQVGVPALPAGAGVAGPAQPAAQGVPGVGIDTNRQADARTEAGEAADAAQT